MKLPPDDRYFSTISSVEEYDKKIAEAESALNVLAFVQLMRGKSAVHWSKNPPENIEVGKPMYDALNESLKVSLAGIGYDLCLHDDRLHVAQIPIVCKPEPLCQ